MSQVFSAILKGVSQDFFLNRLSLTPHQGAQTTLHCALDESLNTVSGKYYDNCKEKRPNKLAEDSDLARRVWDLTLQLVREI